MVVGSRCGRVIGRVLVMHCVVIDFAVVGSVRVTVGGVDALLEVHCAGRCDLQSGALAPSRRAGDKREHHRQNQSVAKSSTHWLMLTGRADRRQQIFGRLQSIRCQLFAPPADRSRKPKLAIL